ncbi:MAG: DUF2809 domain-containing protein [Microcoleaceae cyanobacterium]
MNMTKYRLILFYLLIFLIPFGIFSKYYQGLFQEWINNSFGGIPYIIAWTALILLIQPHFNPKKVAFWVLIVNVFIEFLQLWHPPFLQAIRATFLGRMLLGTTFVFSDFIYYGIGCLLSGWLFTSLKHRFVSSNT